MSERRYLCDLLAEPRLYYLDRSNLEKPNVILLFSKDRKILEAGKTLQFVAKDKVIEFSYEQDQESEQCATLQVGVTTGPEELTVLHYCLSPRAFVLMEEGRVRISAVFDEVPEDLEIRDLDAYLLPDHADADEYTEMLKSMGFD